MTEGTIKTALVAQLRHLVPHYIILRHEDRFIAGVPDLSIDGSGRTTWWEVKYADPLVRTKNAIQEVMMRKMARCSFARYIVYSSRHQKIAIVHPDVLHTWQKDAEMWAEWSHAGVAQTLLGYHHGHLTTVSNSCIVQP